MGAFPTLNTEKIYREAFGSPERVSKRHESITETRVLYDAKHEADLKAEYEKLPNELFTDKEGRVQDAEKARAIAEIENRLRNKGKRLFGLVKPSKKTMAEIKERVDSEVRSEGEWHNEQVEGKRKNLENQLIAETIAKEVGEVTLEGASTKLHNDKINEKIYSFKLSGKKLRFSEKEYGQGYSVRPDIACEGVTDEAVLDELWKEVYPFYFHKLKPFGADVEAAKNLKESTAKEAEAQRRQAVAQKEKAEVDASMQGVRKKISEIRGDK